MEKTAAYSVLYGKEGQFALSLSGNQSEPVRVRVRINRAFYTLSRGRCKEKVTFLDLKMEEIVLCCGCK